MIIGNEPNHAKEWGGKVAPDEYASDDFFILPTGLDASAPNSSVTMDETKGQPTQIVSGKIVGAFIPSRIMQK